MATQSPFPFLDDLFSRLANGLKPPAWMLEEIQRRQVLLVNLSGRGDKDCQEVARLIEKT